MRVSIFKNRIQTIKICAFLLRVFIDIHNSLEEERGPTSQSTQKKFKFSQTIRTSFRFFVFVFLQRILVLLCKSIASYKSQIYFFLNNKSENTVCYHHIPAPVWLQYRIISACFTHSMNSRFLFSFETFCCFELVFLFFFFLYRVFQADTCSFF